MPTTVDADSPELLSASGAHALGRRALRTALATAPLNACIALLAFPLIVSAVIPSPIAVALLFSALSLSIASSAAVADAVERATARRSAATCAGSVALLVLATLVGLGLSAVSLTSLRRSADPVATLLDVEARLVAARLDSAELAYLAVSIAVALCFAAVSFARHLEPESREGSRFFEHVLSFLGRAILGLFTLAAASIVAVPDRDGPGAALSVTLVAAGGASCCLLFTLAPLIATGGEWADRPSEP